MAQDVKFITLTTGGDAATDLRAVLMGLDRVKIVAEVDEPALVAQSVQQFPVDVLLVDLDPNPEAILPIIGEVVASSARTVVFATSESTDGQLILKAMRTGIKEFLPKPIDTNALQEAVDKLASGMSQTTVHGRLITVVGASGGVGSTLIASNLAVELATLASGQLTLVDLDYRFGQVATVLDVEPKYSLSDLCSSPEELEVSIITRALAKHATGVQVLARPNQLAEADAITAASCLGVLSSLIQFNEYVVADGPTRYDSGSQSVLGLSDVTLLVVQQQVPCVRNAVRIIENLRDHGYNLERAKLICNRVGKGTGYLSVKDITETLGIPVFATIPDDWETANGAVNLGEPLLSYGPKSKLRLAIQEIAQRLHGSDAESHDSDARKPGLIGRIFASG